MEFQTQLRNCLPSLLTVAVLIALDQATKITVTLTLPLYSSKPIINGLFNLVHTRNTGVAFSLLADSGPLVKNIILPLVSGVAILVVLVFFWKSQFENRKIHYGLTLMLAGAVGNLYDRLSYGYVVDFLDFFLGSYHWPAFNVADCCITTGAGLLVLDAVLTRGKRVNLRS